MRIQEGFTKVDIWTGLEKIGEEFTKKQREWTSQGKKKACAKVKRKEKVQHTRNKWGMYLLNS